MSELESRNLGAATVLFGERGGRYPDNNALLVRGREETLLVDPGLGVLARGEQGPSPDRIVLSHCHEDHLAGASIHPQLPVEVHRLDRAGLESVAGFLDLFGVPQPERSAWGRALVERFHYRPRPDALDYEDGAVWSLGGGVTVRARHAPGHTRGHCVLHVEPDDLLFVADIDLSSFGPYYGDAWSSLEEFERTLEEARHWRHRHYLSAHHVGLVDHATWVERLERFRRRIGEREERLVEFLSRPRSLEEIVAHRFVYRPGDVVDNLEWIERRSMTQHLDRLVAAGAVEEVDSGCWVATGRS